MALFAKASMDQLASCHPELQLLFNTVIDNFNCVVLEGHRNEADQNAAFLKGTSKLKFPFGKHNAIPSNAVDVAPYPVDWKNIKRFYWFAGYVIGIADSLFAAGKMTHRIRYGGDWNRNYDITDEKGLSDLVHFELVPT